MAHDEAVIVEIRTLKSDYHFREVSSVPRLLGDIGRQCEVFPELEKFAAKAREWEDVRSITKDNWQQKQAEAARWLSAVKAAAEKL